MKWNQYYRIAAYVIMILLGLMFLTEVVFPEDYRTQCREQGYATGPDYHACIHRLENGYPADRGEFLKMIEGE